MRLNAGCHAVYPLDGGQCWHVDRDVKDQRMLDLIAVAMIDAGLTARQVMAAEIHGGEGQPMVTFLCRRMGEWMEPFEITVPLS